MSLTNQMKNLSEEIVASYKNRLKGNEELVKEVQKTMDGFRKDHMEMASTLHANIAKGERERLKSFGPMMKGIRNDVKNILNVVPPLLNKFNLEHSEMTVALRKSLAKGEVERINEFKSMWNDIMNTKTERLKYFNDMMSNIQKEIKEVANYTSNLLKEFDLGHSEMTAALRESLAKGEVERINEFKSMWNDIMNTKTERLEYFKKMMENIQKEISDIEIYTANLLKEFSDTHNEMAGALKEKLSKDEANRLAEFKVMFDELQKYVSDMLNECANERKEMAANWGKLSDTMAKLRAGVLPSPPSKAKKVEAPEMEIVIEKEVKKVEPVVKKPTVAEPQKVLTMEEKVLNYINTHKNGVRVSDMEKPFGETRMRIGFIAKKLLDAGKVKKVDNLYYSLIKK